MKSRFLIFALAALTFALPSAVAQEVGARATELDRVELFELPKVNLDEVYAKDELRVANGYDPSYAESLRVRVTPWGEYGSWSFERGMAVWRLRLRSRGALSLNLGFKHYRMPAGGTLTLRSSDDKLRVGPFTAADNEEHGQLWTPPMATDDLVIEVRVPSASGLELELGWVNHGYAGFGEPHPLAGSCNVDLACGEAEEWRDAGRSVALVSIGGVRFCSGYLVNNTAQDGRPFFVTAYHCANGIRNPASVVVFWNHESDACRKAGASSGEGGDLSQFQTGAIFRALMRDADAVLLELDDPPPAAFDVRYAGWDRSNIEPLGVAAIHHPNTDAKRLAIDEGRPRITSHLRATSPGDGTHLRVAQWELGTTEGGSSGAPLFNRDQRVIGQLHGGAASCDRREADWFGRFAAAWEGAGHPGTRLRDWLDPLGLGVLTLDGLDASALTD